MIQLGYQAQNTLGGSPPAMHHDHRRQGCIERLTDNLYRLALMNSLD
jgi:hypothetical protein